MWVQLTIVPVILANSGDHPNWPLRAWRQVWFWLSWWPASLLECFSVTAQHRAWKNPNWIQLCRQTLRSRDAPPSPRSSMSDGRPLSWFNTRSQTGPFWNVVFYRTAQSAPPSSSLEMSEHHDDPLSLLLFPRHHRRLSRTTVSWPKTAQVSVSLVQVS